MKLQKSILLMAAMLFVSVACQKARTKGFASGKMSQSTAVSSSSSNGRDRCVTNASDLADKSMSALDALFPHNSNEQEKLSDSDRARYQNFFQDKLDTYHKTMGQGLGQELPRVEVGSNNSSSPRVETHPSSGGTITSGDQEYSPVVERGGN